MSNPCIYISRTGDIFAMIALYVDDILFACNDIAWMQTFKATLGARFKIKDLGDLSQVLGMHVIRDTSARIISMDQSKYVKDILIKHSMSDSKQSSLPMEPSFLAGIRHIDSSLLPRVAKDVYPSLLGSLEYTVVRTRPDISTTLSILGQSDRGSPPCSQQSRALLEGHN
jgi:hypothetical protein